MKLKEAPIQYIPFYSISAICQNLSCRQWRCLTTPCSRPRISLSFIVNLAVPQLSARRLMAGVRLFREAAVSEINVVVQLSLESLLDDRYPHASFHDSYIKSIGVDFLTREAKFSITLFVGNPDAREEQPREADGLLTLTGLLYIALEPPDPRYSYDEDALEVSYDGPVETTQFKAAIPKLPGDLPEEAFEHCFFINNWNSFLFIAARGACFEWS